MTTTKRFRTRVLGSTVLMGAATALVLSGCSGGGSGSATSTDASSSTSVHVDAAAAALLPAKYKESGGINVAADMPNPPMEMLDENQNPTGFDYDLAQALGGKLGGEVHVRPADLRHRGAFATGRQARHHHGRHERHG